MTKRMLSLLLALVMTLSLCVPALAADEFEAETVAEVEEQAPEAPAEPEAPEAEVIEEPVVEEEPVAAPEIAAALPVVEEDLEDVPMPIDVGDIAKDVHYKLYKAIQDAEALLADAKAGKLHANDFPSGAITIDADTAKAYVAKEEDSDPFENEVDIDALEEAIANAKDYLAAVEGKEVDYDVTDETIENVALAALEPFVGDDGLSDEVGGSYLTKSSLVTALTTGATATKSTAGADALDKVALSTLDKDTKVTTGDWTKVYHSDYLTKLQTAINAVVAFDEDTSTYADYKAAVYKIYEALAVEESSAMPVRADLTPLNNAISKADTESKKSNYESNHVMSLESAQELIGNAEALRGNTKTGFASTTYYYGVLKMIDDLANVSLANKATIDMKSYAFDKIGSGTNNKASVKVTLSVEDLIEGESEETGDGTVYYYAYKIGTKWFTDPTTYDKDGAAKFASTMVKPLTAISSGWTADDGVVTIDSPLVLKNFGEAETSVADFSNEVITLYLYNKETPRTESDGRVKTITIDTGKTQPTVYSGPTLEEAELTAGEADIDLGSGVSFWSSVSPDLSSHTENNATLTVTLSDAVEDNTSELRLKVNGKAFGTATALAATDSTEKAIIIAAADQADLKAGTVITVELWASAEASGEKLHRKPDVTVTVDPITKWSEIDDIEEIIDAAEDLIPGDYDLGTARPGVTNVTEAFEDIADRIAELKAIITDSKLANSATERTEAVAVLKDLMAACGQLTQKPTDFDEYDEVVAAALEALEKDGTDDIDYDYKAYGVLNALVNDTDGKYTTGDDWDTNITERTQSEVDKAVAEIQAALDALTGGTTPADKTALNAEITAAKAYKEEDYTADSYEALQTAIEAAQAIADKEDASEAEIKGALDALKDAESKLVEKTEEPTVPPVPEKNGRVWEKAEDGTWYCYIDKELQKSTWIYSKGGLWYYVDKDGKMLEGFQKIEGKWYFLQNNDNGGTRGTIVTSADGWIYDDAIPGGCAYAINKRNTGHFGEITWTQAGGDFKNGHFVKGDPTA